jgi:hypothetical protein
MNATFGTAARTITFALVLAVAAALGLAVANTINERGPGIETVGEMTHGRVDRAATSRTANAAFSLDAIAAVQAARGDPAAASTNAGYPAGWQGGAAIPQADDPADDYVDYGLRHAGEQFDPSAAKERLAKPTIR